MAQKIDIRSACRTLGMIGAAACLIAVGMVSVTGQALARAGGGGGHAGGGHSGGGGHMEAEHGGFGHGGYGHGGYGHGGYGHGGFEHGGYGRGGWGHGDGRGRFYRDGRWYYYGDDGAVVEDCCYAAPVYVAPRVVPYFVSPFGVFVR
jgi:hypothetical protein